MWVALARGETVRDATLKVFGEDKEKTEVAFILAEIEGKTGIVYA
jgi:hypothetical protein